MRSVVLALIVVTLAGCRSGDSTAAAASAVESSAAPVASAPATARFGAPLTSTDSLPLSVVLRAPEKYSERTVTVAGTVRRNCTRKGCWMELAESMDPAAQGCRVTFQNYGFFVPLDSAGSVATVEGVVATKLVSAGEVAHMESEGGTFANKRPDGTAHEIRLVATGVELTRRPN